MKNKIDKMLRDRPIKDKLNLVFRMVTISFLLLVVVSLAEMVMSKNIPGIIVILVLAILGVAFNAYVMKRLAALLVAPIESLVVAAEKISQGDFEIGTPYEAEDELGGLSDTFETAAGVLKKVISDLLMIVESFSVGNFNVRSSCPEAYVGQLRSVLDKLNEMVVKISETMHGIQESGEQVSAGSGQLAESAQDIAEGATTQAGETQRAEEQVIEMGNMVQETSDEVEKLLAFAQDMHDCTAQASQILKALEQVNARAEENIDIIAEQTNTTNEAAMKISEATHLITSIAEETNLLALNASIEAARAGEQGKGFGVVASEIQKLAEQTNESAAHIEEIVQELLQDAEKAVETMYGVKEIMHTQSDHVEQTQSAFEQVQSGVQESIEGINRISGHTTRLNDARENVVGIVRNLTAIAEANAAGTEQTSASTTEVGAIMEDISGKSTAMRQAAQELDEGMNIFKL